MNTLAEILGSKSRAEIVRLLIGSSRKELYLREIQRLSGLSISPIQKELDRLERIGLIQTRRDGNRIYYCANTKHPLFPEFRKLVEKTTGVEALLIQALKSEDISIAFIFGSVASGEAKPESDLDLFVIGNLGLRRLSKLMHGMSDRIGREINPHVMDQKEFTRRVKDSDHFISNLMKSKKLFIIGDKSELKRMVRE